MGERRLGRRKRRSSIFLCLILLSGMLWMLAACGAGNRGQDEESGLASEGGTGQRGGADGGVSDKEESAPGESGCQGEPGTGDSAVGEISAGKTGRGDPDTEDMDIAHIIVTLQTLGTDSEIKDLPEVEAAVNAITVPELGVEVEFKTVGALEAFTEYPLWISRGDQVDLMVLNYQDITSYISRNMLLPLEEYLETEGKGILDIMDTGIDPTEASVVGGHTYGVAPIQNSVGGGGGIWTRADYMEEAGLAFDPQHIYTLDELTEVFRAMKAAFPEKYPLGQITSGGAASTAAYYGLTFDTIGGDSVGGVLLDGSSDFQVVSFYASEEYRDFLEHLREWYLAGYIYPDAAFTDTTQTELLREGVIMAYPLNSAPGLSPRNWMEGELACLRTTLPVTGSQYAKSGFWTIPVSSRNPKAAMRFLNAMMTDSRIGNLINFGIEGKHYVVTDEENRLIDFPEGLGINSVGYCNPMGLYGDYRKLYSLETLEEIEAEQAYSEEALRNTADSPTRGIPYSTANVDKELAELQKVVQKYVPVLESGSVDVGKYYPEFLEELKRAGEEKVIADKQEQLDRWMREKNERQGK